MEYIQAGVSVAGQVINYADFDEKMRRLKRKLEVLESREEDVSDELKYAEQLLFKKRRKTVENWLNNVKSIKNQMQELESKVEGSSSVTRPLVLGKRVDALTEEVSELIQEGQSFPDGLTYQAPENGVALLTRRLEGEMFEKNKEKILDCLMNKSILNIGVYGMGGVGKTTLVTHIHNQLLQKHGGTSVSWVTVSRECSIHKLQNDIAETVLHFKFSNEDDETKRAGELALALSKQEDFVLILDDVWDDFQLDEVGIPLSVGGCKLILTTRSLEVCHKMDCQVKFKVEPLSDDEAWNLFTEKLGNAITLSPEIERIAKCLARECDGLPLGIIIMARSMRGVDDICEWSNALDKMKESKVGQDDMERKVFRVLKYSYDMLKDRNLQKCFLYCSLYPEDHEIMRDLLIQHLINERLVEGPRNMQAEYDRGHTILNKLENACLLEGGTDKKGRKYVKMHDLLRDMAIQIASMSGRFLVEAGVGLKDFPEKEKWTEDLVRASLMYNNLSNIPSNLSPRCPRLVTLRLDKNVRLTYIPDCFFIHMSMLAHLDLSDAQIEYLPTSISDLENLVSLLLNRCLRLKYIPPLGKLMRLRALDLSDTKITEVPEGVDNLINIRYLNLDTKGRLMIPDGFFSKLSCLQFLVFCHFNLCTSELKGQEIARLRKLETFKGQFCDVDNFNTYVKSWEGGGLNDYLLLVGRFFFTDLVGFYRPYTKIVCLRKCKISEARAGNESLVLPTDVKTLIIRECKDVTCLCDIASLKTVTDLRKLKIRDCSGMQNMLCPSCCKLYHLQSLEELYIQDFKDWSVLIEREISSNLARRARTFSSLKILWMDNCPNMKRLFTYELFSSNLQNVEDIRVRCCEKMVEIVGKGSEEEEAIEATILNIPKLKRLTLRQLPNLKSFCGSSRNTIVSSSLESIEIIDCPKLRRIPLLGGEECPASLQKIMVQPSWWDSLNWNHFGPTKVSLQTFCQFEF